MESRCEIEVQPLEGESGACAAPLFIDERAVHVLFELGVATAVSWSLDSGMPISLTTSATVLNRSIKYALRSALHQRNAAYPRTIDSSARRFDTSPLEALCPRGRRGAAPTRPLPASTRPKSLRSAGPSQPCTANRGTGPGSQLCTPSSGEVGNGKTHARQDTDRPVCTTWQRTTKTYRNTRAQGRSRTAETRRKRSAIRRPGSESGMAKSTAHLSL